jgi:predicted nuclease of restriction endonuclease-like (RecB) superfamily
VEKLSQDLHGEFPGIGGFSPSNLWRMKMFYELYHKNEKLAQLVREIGWSHNIAIMEMCGDDSEREFYLGMAKTRGWGRNTIIRQIECRPTRRQ